MFALTHLVLPALLSSSLFFGARADPNPTAPSPGQSFNEGAQCHVAWDADTTGTWKTMNIELMTGNNFDMVYLTTVGTVDGTDATKTTLDYPCPSVTPNSAIYFYQFTSPASSAVYWTTRFAIADTSGKTTPPAQATQPNGDAIPWGTGALTNSASAIPQPSSGAGNNTSAVTGTALSATSSLASSSGSGSSSSAASSASAVAGTGSGSPPMVTVTRTGSLNGGPSTTGSPSNSNSNGAAGAASVDVRVFVALGAVALALGSML